MLTLVVTGGEGPQLTLNVEKAQRVSIGRSHDNAVVLPDASVSRHHAELVPSGERWILRDRGSYNGTFLNGRRVQPRETATVSRGARIDVGRYAIHFSPAEDLGDSLLIADDPLDTTDVFTVSADDPLTDPRELETLIGPAPDAERAPHHRLRSLLVVEKANLELLGFEPAHVLYEKILDQVMHAVRPARAALFVTDSDGKLTCEALRGDDDGRKMLVSGSLVDTVVEKKLSILMPRTAERETTLTDSLETAGIRSVMAAPLIHENQTVGLIYADASRTGKRFHEDDLRVLTALANIAATRVMLGKVQAEERSLVRHQQELHAAARVQRRLLPKDAVPIEGYSLDGFNRPCYEVGGDFFDYLELDQDRHGVVLADVAGKGLPAALLLMGVQAYTRSYFTLKNTLDGLAGFLNDGMLRYAPRNRFVSFFAIELDRHNHVLRWCNAGHAPSPVIVRVDGSIKALEPSGLPLGVLPTARYEIAEAELGRGDLLVMCSDGVTDAANAAEEPFGEERLLGLLKSMAGAGPDDVRRAILDAVEDHSQDTPNSDDLTVVAVRRDPVLH